MWRAWIENVDYRHNLQVIENNDDLSGDGGGGMIIFSI